MECQFVLWVLLAEDWGTLADSCKHGNKPSGSIKDAEFPDLLRDC
jgi:hypothetical protein